MEYTKEELLEMPVFSHFNQLCQIPHASGNEKALSDYLLQWGKQRKLDIKQDKWHNIFISKPASKGYEKAPVIMLQAHIDMVADKAAHVKFDWEKDPVEWFVDGDIISTKGKTTLGADDGVGVALAMAILEDEKHPHPALEVAFTTNEEDDFSGADGFAFPIKADYLLNLDSSNEKRIVCSSCGGMEATITLPVNYEEVPHGYTGYRIAISGMAGGHSGQCVNKGYDNANALLGRFMLELHEHMKFMLGGLEGGTFRLTLSRGAWVDMAFLRDNLHLVEEAVEKLRKDILEEHPLTGKDVKVELIPIKMFHKGVRPGKIINLLVLAADGVHQMNEMFTDTVASSDNMGVVKLDKKKFTMIFEIRSLQESVKNFLFEKLCLIAKIIGGKCKGAKSYPGWPQRAKSPLRDKMVAVYQEFYGEMPEVVASQGGLEVAYFFKLRKNLDAVSIGPNRWLGHTPEEKMSISSTAKFYEYLQKLLAEIKA